MEDIVKQMNEELSEEEHLRAVLNFYDLKRMTPTVKLTFKKANENRFSYVNSYND